MRSPEIQRAGSLCRLPKKPAWEHSSTMAREQHLAEQLPSTSPPWFTSTTPGLHLVAAAGGRMRKASSSLQNMHRRGGSGYKTPGWRQTEREAGCSCSSHITAFVLFQITTPGQLYAVILTCLPLWSMHFDLSTPSTLFV